MANRDDYRKDLIIRFKGCEVQIKRSIPADTYDEETASMLDTIKAIFGGDIEVEQVGRPYFDAADFDITNTIESAADPRNYRLTSGRYSGKKLGELNHEEVSTWANDHWEKLTEEEKDAILAWGALLIAEEKERA